jgi:hypothetical protein
MAKIISVVALCKSVGRRRQPISSSTHRFLSKDADVGGEEKNAAVARVLQWKSGTEVQETNQSIDQTERRNIGTKECG